MSAIPNINFETIRQNEPYEGMSKRYQLIRSSDVVEKFEKQGFVITDYSEARTRVEEKQNKQKHFIRMALSEDVDALERPEVVLHNSYDGSASLQLHVGVYRFVCSNGMILGSNTVEPLKIRHNTKDWDYRIFKFMETYDTTVSEQQSIISNMKSQFMSHDDEYRFAEMALKLREDVNDVLDPSELLRVNRIEDRGSNLWLTFNKVQENLIQGNFKKIFRKRDEELGLIKSTAKASVLTDINRIMAINSGLGDMAKQHLKVASGIF